MIAVRHEDQRDGAALAAPLVEWLARAVVFRRIVNGAADVQRLPADADRPAVVIGEAHRKEVEGRRVEGHVRRDAQAGEFLCELADALAERLNDV